MLRLGLRLPEAKRSLVILRWHNLKVARICFSSTSTKPKRPITAYTAFLKIDKPQGSMAQRALAWKVRRPLFAYTQVTDICLLLRRWMQLLELRMCRYFINYFEKCADCAPSRRRWLLKIQNGSKRYTIHVHDFMNVPFYVVFSILGESCSASSKDQITE